MKVYVLQHVHTLPEGEESVKMIGVYRSQESAQAAVARTRELPGFRDHPAICHLEGDGFYIDPYELDEDNWTTGYKTCTVD